MDIAVTVLITMGLF